MTSGVSGVERGAIFRSASSHQLANSPEAAATTDDTILRRALSDNVLEQSQGGSWSRRHVGDLKHANGALESGEKPVSRRASIHFSLGRLLNEETEDLEEQGGNSSQTYRAEIGTKSVSRSFSRLTQRSWISKSRSPSPSKSSARRNPKTRTDTHVKTASETPTASSTSDGNEDTIPILPAWPSKARRRPLSTFMSKSPSTSKVPYAPQHGSLDPVHEVSSVRKPSPSRFPRLLSSSSSDRLQILPIETSRKKDELRGAFRTLDTEFHKFQSRISTLKTAVIRSTLLPFLRSSSNNSLNTMIRSEDLDRRVNVLDKWWIGLLEMLNGKNGESVSGSDRPTILDAITMIMTRHEWAVPFHMSPSGSADRSTTSLGSSSWVSSKDTIMHNIKTRYAQNLLSQLVYVLGKMSSKTVPASVVTFCGKSIAYAFFYCDGVAEILVRLWAAPRRTIKRVIAEHHIEEGVDLNETSDYVASHFPPGLHGLAFRSLNATMRHLRSRPQLPLANISISWQGPWLQKWIGRDTDLFFVFVKKFFHLIHTFLPSGVSTQERVCAPSYILVQAQMLTVMDDLFQQNIPKASLAAPSVKLDKLAGGTDALASLMVPPPNCTSRSMAENRLVILLRDCLTGNALDTEKKRQIFAEAFEDLLRASARRISLFDYSACVVLCDFLEEAVAILIRFEKSTATPSYNFDWPFWLNVFTQMIRSQNVMTEIRLHALLYSLWSVIAADEILKQQVCLEWLLSEETFRNQFSHWCPMVRAYYMRLLCWRIGRLGESGLDLDVDFARSQENILSSGGRRLSTAPCSPAPSRRLRIIRNDSQPILGNRFLTFESILGPSLTTAKQATPRQNQAPKKAPVKSTEDSSMRGKKSWISLKNVIPFVTSASPPSNNTAQQNATNIESTDSIEQGRTNKTSSSQEAEEQVDKPYQIKSFRFALEWMDDARSPFGKERQLHEPRVPFTTSRDSDELDRNALHRDTPTRERRTAATSKYTGLALAEWELVVQEFQDFSRTRRSEGIPRDSLVETPTLGIETFRR
ncbi:MAG: hypothetical protein Q9220_000250 [cf. Caloplaca sp. 1 TL-2023]